MSDVLALLERLHAAIDNAPGEAATVATGVLHDAVYHIELMRACLDARSNGPSFRNFLDDKNLRRNGSFAPKP